MIKDNYRVYGINAKGNFQGLIKIYRADKAGNREEAIACAKMWAKYGKPGDIAKVIRYTDGLPVEFVKYFKKVGNR